MSANLTNTILLMYFIITPFNHRGVILSMWFVALLGKWHQIVSSSTAYFPVFTCRSLSFDLIILVFNFLLISITYRFQI